MTQNTKIEWADHTFNPWWGCTKISPACDNCYAAALDKRTGGDHWGANQPRKRTSAKNWLEPVKWNKQADAFFAEHGRRQRVFSASMADVFDNAIDPQWRADLIELIAETPNLDWLLLTKRIGNAHQMLDDIVNTSVNGVKDLELGGWQKWMLNNIWLGATICNQAEANRDIPKLLAVPAAKRFLSIEPMLAAINLDDAFNVKHWGFDPDWEGCKTDIDWVICGGESGPGARPMHPDWARSLRDQCDRACVPFLFKQWGEWEIASAENGHHDCDMSRNKAYWLHSDGVLSKPSSLRPDLPLGFDPETYGMVKVGKKAAGRLLDGMEHNGAPA